MFWLLVALLAAFAVLGAHAGVANAGVDADGSTNPLYGLTLGSYLIANTEASWVLSVDGPSYYYHHPHNAADREYFAKVVNTPRAVWFGGWDTSPRQAAASYVSSVQNGNPNVLVPLAIFRLEPYEDGVYNHLPSAGEIAEYHEWIREFAAGLGDARVALILQPDAPFALFQYEHWHKPVFFDMLDWSTKIFSALLHTTVYIECGASDWISPEHAAFLLERSGIQHARGIALDTTHYQSDEEQYQFGMKVIAELAKKGIHDKHMIINRGSNGRPFSRSQSAASRAAFAAETVCATPHSTICKTFGGPPEILKSGPVDAYLWTTLACKAGRPYEYQLDLIKNSPFANVLPPKYGAYGQLVSSRGPLQLAHLAVSNSSSSNLDNSGNSGGITVTTVVLVVGAAVLVALLTLLIVALVVYRRKAAAAEAESYKQMALEE